VTTQAGLTTQVGQSDRLGRSDLLGRSAKKLQSGGHTADRMGWLVLRRLAMDAHMYDGATIKTSKIALRGCVFTIMLVRVF
jgi:hypothetical protein